MSGVEVNAKKSTLTPPVVSTLMASSPRKTTVFRGLNSSVDVYEKEVSDESAEEVVEAIDCFVLGSRTYEHALQLGWRRMAILRPS